MATTKGRPPSIRLRRDFEELLEREAERAGLPKSRMLERLAEEGLRMRRFPGLTFRGPEHRRRAAITGTGVDVWEFVMLHQAEGRDAVLASPPVAERQLDLALSYHRGHPADAVRFLAENARPPEDWQRLYPGLDIWGHRADDGDGARA